MLNHLTYLGILLVLAFMVFQDFRYRGITWYLFPLLAILLVFSARGNFSLFDAGLNLGFVILLVLLLTCYFSLRNGRLLNILAGFLGFGDILLLVCIGVYLPVLVFVLFYAGSLLLILVGTGTYLKFRSAAGYTVPLAGLQALLLIPVIGIIWAGHIQLARLNDQLLLLLI